MCEEVVSYQELDILGEEMHSTEVAKIGSDGMESHDMVDESG